MASASMPLSADERTCVVCGMASHRTDWIKRTKVGATLYVACDSHTDQQMAAAVNAAEVKAKKAADPATALEEAAKRAANKTN